MATKKLPPPDAPTDDQLRQQLAAREHAARVARLAAFQAGLADLCQQHGVSMVPRVTIEGDRIIPEIGLVVE